MDTCRSLHPAAGSVDRPAWAVTGQFLPFRSDQRTAVEYGFRTLRYAQERVIDSLRASK